MIGLAGRDERERSIDHAADRLAYLVLSFGLLVDVAWRSVVRGEPAWDLLALVVVGGVVGTAYRSLQGAAGRRWLGVAGASAAVGLVVAIVLAATRS
jgi:hypothetical protein